jgi:hypothetical protein
VPKDHHEDPAEWPAAALGADAGVRAVDRLRRNRGAFGLGFFDFSGFFDGTCGAA